MPTTAADVAPGTSERPDTEPDSRVSAAADDDALRQVEGLHLEERLRVVNRIISLAHQNSQALRRNLTNAGPLASAARRDGVVRAWVAGLGRSQPSHAPLSISLPIPLPRPSESAEGAVESSDRALPALTMWTMPPAIEQLSKWERRWQLFRFGLRRRRRRVLDELSKRSEVFRRLVGSSERSRRAHSHSMTDRLLMVVALVALAPVALCALPTVLVLLVLLPLGTLHPQSLKAEDHRP